MKVFRPLIVATGALLALAAAPVPAPPDAGELESELARIAADAGGPVGVSALHVQSGRTVFLDPAGRYPMASVVKLPLALAVLAEVDAGRMRLSERLEARAWDVRTFGPIGEGWKPGATYSVELLLEAMLVESDNTATDLLFKRLGGPGRVASWLESAGLSGIQVSRTELQLGADWTGLTGLPSRGLTPSEFRRRARGVSKADRERAQERFERDPRDTATPEGMVRLLVKLQRRELLSPSSTAHVLADLRRCRTGDARIRALLPPGTPVWDKTGTMGRGANDVGLVELPSGGHLALAVFVKSSTVELAAREKVIARIARAAWDFFGGASPESR